MISCVVNPLFHILSCFTALPSLLQLAGIAISIDYGTPAPPVANGTPPAITPQRNHVSAATPSSQVPSSLEPTIPSLPLCHRWGHNLAEKQLAYVDAKPDDSTGYSFEAPPIYIKNVVGQPDIDVLQAFRKLDFSDRQLSNLTYKDTGIIHGIPLPPSVYPPNWDAMDDLRKAIRQGAKEGGIEFTCKHTESPEKKRTKTEGEGAHFILACKCNSISAAKKKKDLEFVNAEPLVSDWGVPTPRYDYSQRQDPIIGQASGIRKEDGDPKGIGKTHARRTESEMRDGDTSLKGGKRCPFQLRVTLIEGVCWHVPHKNRSNLCHAGHMKVKRGEMSGKKNSLGDEEVKVLKQAEKNFSCGVGMQNFAKEITGKCVI